MVLALPAVLCGGSCNHKKQNLNGMANRIARSSLADEYPRIPGDELLREVNGNSLYSELKDRYTQNLSALKNEVERDQAKLIIVIMTPEIGKFTTAANTYGIPYIAQSCSALGIDCVDFTPDIAEWLEADEKNAPVEGNWTKTGTAFMAGQLGSVLAKYDDYHNPKIFPSDKKPETFGDLATKEDDVLDGEKNIPYRLTVNAQGLRMGHLVTFPKRKQTVLFMGDCNIFNPYVDNEYIITEHLQARYPEKEIINAGHLKYTMEDHYSLYIEKARYVEPDIVVVCTNGSDILKNYFSQRNRYSRSGKSYKPSPLEKKFYEQK